MDNDLWIKKKLVSQYRKLKLKLDYIDANIISESRGNTKIEENIYSKEPFMCVRLGAVEARCIDKWMKGEKFTEENIDQIHYAAGVFPQEFEIVHEFCELYAESIKSADMIGVWSVKSEKKIINRFCPSAQLVPLKSIEPYYHQQPWSKALKGKRVLVIHPFVESIERQYENREKLFKDNKVLPTFKELILIRAVQSNAGAKSEFTSWFDALESMKRKIEQSEFDIAIIGAGAYGLPLASYIKSLGKQAIQMGGSTQILFGIKGKRWDNHSYISELYNDNWVRPTAKETPPKINKVEGGSYW